MSVDFLTKYAPKSHNDLLIPHKYKELVADIFNGRLTLADKGFILHGDYGVGKTETVNLLKKVTGWKSYTITSPASVTRKNLEDIREAYFGAHNTLQLDGCIANSIIQPARFIIECNEVSRISSDLLKDFTLLIDDFYDFAKECEDKKLIYLPALWLFTDNHYSQVSVAAPGVFSPGRISPLKWEVPRQDIIDYALKVLELEGLYTQSNIKIVNDIAKDNKLNIRGVLTSMKYKITRE